MSSNAGRALWIGTVHGVASLRNLRSHRILSSGLQISFLTKQLSEVRVDFLSPIVTTKSPFPATRLETRFPDARLLSEGAAVAA
jgi:hypothetical protein